MALCFIEIIWFFFLKISVIYFALTLALWTELGRDNLSLLHIVFAGQGAHAYGSQVGVTVIWASVSFLVGFPLDCLSFLMAWWLASKHEHCKRQKVEAVSFLKLELRNWHHILMVTQLKMWIWNKQWYFLWKYVIWISFNASNGYPLGWLLPWGRWFYSYQGVKEGAKSMRYS